MRHAVLLAILRTLHPTTPVATIADVSRAGQWAEVVVVESFANGLDPLVVTAVIAHESGWRPLARGRAGEVGLGQIMPSTAAEFEAAHGRSLWDAAVNIRLTCLVLARLRDTHKGHTAEAWLSLYKGLSLRPSAYSAAIVKQAREWQLEAPEGRAEAAE